MTSEPTLPIEQLLAQSDWVTRLARVLVHDPAAADDVVQSTWVDVLRAPPRHGLRLRAWLASIVRRKAARLARTATRRDRREQIAADLLANRTAESPADLAARVATHRELVDAVLALDEPCREAVVLRYFENLTVEAIAVRIQTKVNTVRSRLQRGLQALRNRLDRMPGGRERWLPAVAALGERALAPGTTVGTVGMAAGIALAITMKQFVLFGAALVAAILLILPWLLPDAAVAVPLVDLGPLADASSSAAPVANQGAARPTDLAGRAAAALPAADLSRPGRHVVDREGRPLSGVAMRADSPYAVSWQGGDRGWIRGPERSLRIDAAVEDRLRTDPGFAEQFFASFAHPDEWRATVLGTPLPAREVQSDDHGAFTFAPEVAASDAIISVGDPAFVLVAAGASGQRPWIASPATRVTGLVRDEFGNNLADTFSMPMCVVPDNVVELAGQLEIRTDDDGRFLVRRAAANGLLRVRRDGYATAFVPLTAEPQQHVEVVLQRRVAAGAQQLGGLVVDGGGHPIAAAKVWFGRQNTQTGKDGRFVIPSEDPAPQYALTIVAKGFALLQLDGLGAELAESATANQDRLFVLTRRPVEARGIVVGSDGVPLAGALVGLLDPTLLDVSFDAVEARVGGWNGGVATGPDGSFALAGLADRAYRIRAVDPSTGAIATSAPHRAADGDLVLRLPRDLRRAVRGTVRLDDQPVAGATVEVGYCTHITKGGGTMFDNTPAVACDREGRFELAVLPRRDAWLIIRIDGSIRHMEPVEHLSEGDDLVIDVDGRRWLQLVGSAFPLARSIHFELADGTVLASIGQLDQEGAAPSLPLPASAVAVVLDHAGPHASRLELTDDRAVLLRVR